MLSGLLEQFDGIPRGRVLLAMSGGVDSSVAALVLREAGFEVVGCFMRLGSPGDAVDELVGEDAACAAKGAKLGKQGCCSVGDAGDARQVAALLGIPFYVCNFKRDFGRIIDYFVDEYTRGRTPNPCVRCNDWLKFGKLFEYADQIDAGFVASGHYARVGKKAPGTRHQASGGRSARLLRGIDSGKDQSYVLFGIQRERLGRLLLPIGGMEKSRVRAIAERAGLPVFDKPDSYEICFVPDNDYAQFVEQRRPELGAQSGEVLDAGGAVIGRHGGHHHFTIGQRRGVGIALGHPVYVVEKNPADNTITLGLADDLLVDGCEADDANWLADQPPPGARFRCFAQWRSNGRAAAADCAVVEGGRFAVWFDEPQRAVAPGQPVVLYAADEPDRVLGGGWISRAHRGAAQSG